MTRRAAESLADLPLEAAAMSLDRGETTAVELVEAVLTRIDRHDPRYRAFLTVDRGGARAQAREADERRVAGRSTPLTGLPVALKDNLLTRGLRTTCASRMLDSFVPAYDATVVSALREAGAVIVGKTNLDEFAMGGSTEGSAFFPTRNPWDPGRVPGGSSGGSAAAVVFGGCSFALGSDTGGSVRQPASFCGVVGMKPTYGRVSRWGLVAMASSLDQVGPLTRTVRDNAVVLGALSGHDPRDSTSAREGVPDFLEGIEDGLEGMTVGVVPGLLEAQGVAPGVAEVFAAAQGACRRSGARISEVELPHLEQGVAVYYVICPSEVSSNMARFDGLRYGTQVPGPDLWETYRRTRGAGFGPEVKRRILLGSFGLSAGYYDAYYKKASQVRTLIAAGFRRALSRCDVLLLPVTPTPAFRQGELADDPLRLYLADVFTVGVSLAGLPAVSLPAGSVDGLPQGVQLVGRRFAEATVYRAARALEKATAASLADRLRERQGDLG